MLSTELQCVDYALYYRACSATLVSKPGLPNHCRIASKFGKTGIFETGHAILARAGFGFGTRVAERALCPSSQAPLTGSLDWLVLVGC
jgi:hypothetical protein